MHALAAPALHSRHGKTRAGRWAVRDDMLWMRVPRNRKVGRLGALCAAGRLLRLRYRPAVRVVRGGVVVYFF